jgi:hypothetical protein
MGARQRSGKTWVVVLALATAWLASDCSHTPPPPPDFVPPRAIYPLSEAEKGTLTTNNSDKIQEGVAQAELRAIFGTPGPSVTRRTDNDVYELVWKYRDKKIALRFRGQRAVSKSQVGLEP